MNRVQELQNALGGTWEKAKDKQGNAYIHNGTVAIISKRNGMCQVDVALLKQGTAVSFLEKAEILSNAADALTNANVQVADRDGEVGAFTRSLCYEGYKNRDGKWVNWPHLAVYSATPRVNSDTAAAELQAQKSRIAELEAQIENNKLRERIAALEAGNTYLNADHVVETTDSTPAEENPFDDE